MGDFVVLVLSFQEQVKHLKEILQKLRGAYMKLSPKECKVFRKDAHYFGHIVSTEGIKADTEKAATV